MMQWLKRVWCGLAGHDYIFNFESGFMKLKCLNCLKETSGLRTK